MTSNPGRFRLYVLLVGSVFLLGCTSWQLREAGDELGKSAVEQLFVLAVSGVDGLSEYNQREREKRERETNPYRSSITREELIEYFERSRQWEAYQDRLAGEGSDSRPPIPGESADDRMGCREPERQSFVCL